MFCNGRPSRNKRYVPNVRYILDRLDKLERLAISPENDENMEVEMKEKIEGDTEIFEEMGKEDPREVYKDDLEGIEVGPSCPNCDLKTQYHNGTETCPVHGPVVVED